MDEIHTKALVKKHPLLYADMNKPPTQSLMCFGIACGDGWFKLINDLSDDLERLIKKWRKANPKEKYWPCACQVKEKFGGLRFYMTFGSEEIFSAINAAERKSFCICERCGKTGRPRNVRGWITTLCDKCRDAGEKRWVEEQEKKLIELARESKRNTRAARIRNGKKDESSLPGLRLDKTTSAFEKEAKQKGISKKDLLR